MKKKPLATLLALASLETLSAQATAPSQATLTWGAVHLTAGQAIVLSLAANTQAPPALPVELTLTDRSGNVVCRYSTMLNTGHSISLIIGPDVRTAIPTDIYAIVGPDVRVLTPTLKITFPPGPTSQVDLVTPRLEFMDAATGRVVAIAANPHTSAAQ